MFEFVFICQAWFCVFMDVFAVPGRQLLVLHAVCCSRGPGQLRPPDSGSCRTVFLRSDTPPPQEALQSVQDDYSHTTQPGNVLNALEMNLIMLKKLF